MKQTEFDEKHFLENLFGGLQPLTSPGTRHLDLAQQAALQAKSASISDARHRFDRIVGVQLLLYASEFYFSKTFITSRECADFDSGHGRLGTEAGCAGRSPDRWLTIHRLERVWSFSKEIFPLYLY
jgi:hypothetical protein